MVGYYNYTVWLTYCGLALGIAGIFFALTGNPLGSVICLGFCGVLDTFDGKVARTKKDRTDEEKAFGIQIDSLSDLVCFGVLPAVTGYACGVNKWYFYPLLALFVVAGMIRLAYFNVLEDARQKSNGKMEYVGVPITTSAIVFPLIYMLKAFMDSYFYILYAVLLFVVGMLFIIKVKLPKPSPAKSLILAFGVVLLFFILLIVEIATGKI